MATQPDRGTSECFELKRQLDDGDDEGDDDDEHGSSRSGLGWSGVVLSGLVWWVRTYVWSGLVLYDLLWSGLVWGGLVWSGVARSGPV